jgi:hypothetical protein
MSFSHGALTPDGSSAGCMNRRTNKWPASTGHLISLTNVIRAGLLRDW